MIAIITLQLKCKPNKFSIRFGLNNVFFKLRINKLHNFHLNLDFFKYIFTFKLN